MPDHGDGVAGGNLEIDVEQDLAFGLVKEIDVLEADRAPAHRQDLRLRRVLDFAVFSQQAEHAFHVGKSLLDFAINHAEKIERNIKLDHERVAQHQVADGHAAVDDAN